MLSLTRTTNRLDCVFPSSLEMVDKALSEARKFMAARQKKFDEFEFRLVLREALNNAVIHGNRRNEALRVALTIQCGKKNIKITVMDQGPGFDWRQRLERTTVNPDQTGGRGLILLRSSGYDISYNKAGNRLTLNKIIT